MKYQIHAQGVPTEDGPYSQGTTAGRLVFASGQLGRSPEDPSRLVGGGAAAQAERALDLVEALLAPVGLDLSDVAKATLYLADLGDLEAVDEVWSRRFLPPAPARSVVAVAELPLGALVEIDAVACR